MSAWKGPRGRRQTILLILCLTCFFAAVLGVFTVQQRRLNLEIDRLVSDNLAGFTSSQRRQAVSQVEDIRGTLGSIAVMVEQIGVPPEEGWLQTYLSDLSQRSGMYTVDFIPAQTLRAGLTGEETRTADRAAVAKLLEGERLVSEIERSQRLGGSYFAVAEPVFQNGAVQGALRTRVDASLLTGAVEAPGLFSRVFSLVVSGEGEIVYAGDQEFASDGDLFSSLTQNGVGPEAVEGVRAVLQACDSTVYSFQREGKTFFACASGLGFNDWHIVNFIRSDDVQAHSRAILQVVVWSGVILILLTMLAGVAIGALALRQKRRLSLEQQRYATLSQFSDTVLFEYQLESDAIEFTPNARQQLQLGDLTIHGLSHLMHRPGVGLLHPDDRGVVVRSIRALAGETNSEIHYQEVRLRCADGNYRWFGCQYRPIRGSAGSCAMVVGKLVDITDQRSREQMLLERAQRDVLTDTYNKAGEHIISERVQAGGKGLFFMIDLDNFKEINDTRGHAVGDTLLTGVGEVLKKLFRANDIVARVGGDEFVAFLSDVTDRTVAEQKARAILERVSSIEGEGYGDARISASIGIAVCPTDGDSYEALYRAADRAMYRAKQQGKAGFAFYQSE